VGVLKEKFNSKLVEVKQALYKPYFQAEECEKIADDYAIEFSNWLFNINKEVLKKQLQEFKKEKGL
jgi:hypothetical protein